MAALQELSLVQLGLGLLVVAGSVFLVLSLGAVLRFRRSQMGIPTLFRPPLTVLKPLCGDEPRLYECLRSFVAQDYPAAQIVFGIRESTDPAADVVRRLQAEFPHRDLQLVCDARIHGSNLKISNVMNMAHLARHPFIMVSDSDVEVAPGFLSAVMAEMKDPELGLLSCIYRGHATQGWVSRLGAANINQFIIPSILVDRMLSGHEASLGPALVLRRQVLEAAGGFEGVANHLAEDCELGRRVEAAGWKVRLAGVTVDTMVNEHRLGDLVRHEVRWAHTVRAVRPMDHLLSVVTCALPVMLALLVLDPTLFSVAMVGGYMGLRLALAAALRSRFGHGHETSLWTVWPRECLCFLVWAISLFSRAVIWRGQSFVLLKGGLLVPETMAGGSGATAIGAPPPEPKREPAE